MKFLHILILMKIIEKDIIFKNKSKLIFQSFVDSLILFRDIISLSHSICLFKFPLFLSLSFYFSLDFSALSDTPTFSQPPLSFSHFLNLSLSLCPLLCLSISLSLRHSLSSIYFSVSISLSLTHCLSPSLSFPPSTSLFLTLCTKFTITVSASFPHLLDRVRTLL